MFAIGIGVWNVKTVLPSNTAFRKPDGEYALGATDKHSHTIYISGALSPDKYEKVLAHEVVHAYAFDYGLNIDRETEELLADFVATYGRHIFNDVDRILMKFDRKYAV